MLSIEIIYITAALIAIAACIPQIRQLVVSKASDELSLATWVLWLATQFVTLLYVISIGNKLMMAVNIAWVTFYGIMVGLIIRYRYFGRTVLSRPTDEQPELS